MSLTPKEPISPIQRQIAPQCKRTVSYPLFDMLPPAFELLLPEVRPSTSPHDSLSVFSQSASKKKVELKALLKKNKEMKRKIERTLEFVSSVDHCDMFSTPFASGSVSQNSAASFPREDSDYVHELAPGPFVLKIPLRRESHNGRERRGRASARRPKSKEELLQTLERLKPEILSEVSLWTHQSCSHKRIIDLLEAYKRAIRRLIRRLSKEEDAYITLFEKLDALKRATETEQLKVPLYFSYTPSKRKRALDNPNDTNNGYTNQPSKLAKAYMKALGGKDSPWLQTFSYFPKIPESVLDLLQSLHKPLIPPLIEGTLPMHAINRLSAIAKMLQYCRASRIDLEQFQRGRIRQKIAALQQQRKCLAEDHHKKSTFYKPECETIEPLSYPTLDELDYLLSLDISKLEGTILNLKETITMHTNPENDGAELLEKEQEFNKLINIQKEKYKDIVEKIMVGMREEEQTVPNEDDLIKEYMNLVPKMMKKREKRLAEENKIIKRAQVAAQQEPVVTGKVCIRYVENAAGESSVGDESANIPYSSNVPSGRASGISSIRGGAFGSSDSESASYSFNSPQDVSQRG